MDDKRYTLMNKNRPVLDFLYNLDTNEVRSILSHNPNMPPARIESIIRGIDCRWQPCRFR